MMIGVPPYSPGDYLTVAEDDEGNVSILLADNFRRPLRLTPAEGLALLAAGRALLAVPGSDPTGPLATALDKLEDALQLPELVVDVGRPEKLPALRDAADAHERVEIEYWSGRGRAHHPSHRSRSGVLRNGPLVRRCVLPPRARRAHVPRRPDPQRAADG